MGATLGQWALALVSLVGLVLTACGATTTLPIATPEPTAPKPIPTQTPLMTTPVGLEGSQAAVSAAQADLARTLNLSERDISLQKIEAVQWRDSSLGCPKSGHGYLQMITPGFRIWLEAQGQTYEYHSDMRGNVVSCGEGQEPVPTEPSPGPTAGSSADRMVELAKADLAKRLGISAEGIALVKADSVRWSDACLGIHRPGVGCAAVIVPGFLILLSAQGQTYEYHTDLSSRVLLCESGPGTCR